MKYNFVLKIHFTDLISKTPETISDAAVRSLCGIKNYDDT